MSSKVVCLTLFIIFLSINVGYSQTITLVKCLECHSDSTLTKTVDDSIEVSLYVDQEKFGNSVHGGFECVDCHNNIEEIPHDENLKHPDCHTCHDDIAAEYSQSLHGMSLAKGDKDAPYCWDCHSSHYVYASADSLSMTSKLNQPVTCAKCHSDPSFVKKHHIPIANPSSMYETSVHFKMIKENGSSESASCSDCHGGHDLQAKGNPTSKINKFNIAKTCSQCHGEIYQEYIESIHGAGLMAGRSDNPVCTDCHAEHAIKMHTDPTSTVYSTVVSKTLCANCHEAERIVAKYGLKDNVVQSYYDSYHGLAVRGGSIVSANCASCHGIHNIRPSIDPKSTIHQDNLTETCGTCHPGVSAQVTKGPIHVYASPQSNKIIYYVTMFYYMMIFGVIGGMVLHNGLDFRKKLVAKVKGTHEPHFNNFNGGAIERLTANERIQHFLLMGSFTLLVYTGFAMKFPEDWWAAPLIRWEGAFAFRGWLHRIAAAVMIGLSLYHVIYLITKKRGKEQVKALIPKLKDLQDIIQIFQYYLGLAKVKPKFDRYNYVEKAEYWALIWGTVVMSITGFILWFENISLRFFPKWITDVSTVIHLYEAILATLAILVWHFYFQFFDPHVYPMNTTCITGKMKAEDYKDEHPLDYERLTGS
ncbi:MAG TPA: cytochrome b/b6 domain-containing protein [bacterium]